MVNFDKKINGLVSQYGGIYRRYSDDFIVVLPESNMTKATFNKKFNQIVNYSENIAKLEIELHKTKKFYIKNGEVTDLKRQKVSSLDYLGFVLNNNKISIRSKSIYKYRYRGKRSIRSNGRNTWKLYLQPIPRSKPRESFLSYAKLSQNIFSVGNLGYKVIFLHQLTRARKKLKTYRSNLFK